MKQAQEIVMDLKEIEKELKDLAKRITKLEKRQQDDDEQLLKTDQRPRRSLHKEPKKHTPKKFGEQ